ALDVFRQSKLPFERAVGQFTNVILIFALLSVALGRSGNLQNTLRQDLDVDLVRRVARNGGLYHQMAVLGVIGVQRREVGLALQAIREVLAEDVVEHAVELPRKWAEQFVPRNRAQSQSTEHRNLLLTLRVGYAAPHGTRP